MAAVSKIVKYFVKPGKSILINKGMQSSENFFCKLAGDVSKNGKIIPNASTQAKLGDASVFIDALLKQQLPEAKAQVQLMFEDLNSVVKTTHRAKGILSIDSKLLREINKTADKTFHNIAEATSHIGDGIGSRVITKSLGKLKKEEIQKMISEMTIQGRKLTAREESLLTKFIYEKPMHPVEYKEGFKLFEQFATPLVEKRSCEVVNQLKLGVIKHRIQSGELSVAKAEEMFGANIVKKAQASDVLPLQITEINNYKGMYGLSEFTDNQIAELSVVINSGKTAGQRAIVYSDPKYSKIIERWGDSVDNSLVLSEQEAQKVMKETIKPSGYRTAQINVIHSNGAFGEIQFKGEQTLMFGEYEHIAYDLRQGKNTLGEIFDEYGTAIKKLNNTQYSKYNEYLQRCYNYYNRIELGLPAVKPELPRGFDKVLSVDNMKILHNKNQQMQRYLNKGFSQHLQEVA